MDSEIVYLVINDWLPREWEKRFLNDLKLKEESKKKLIQDKVCMVVDLVEYSVDYYITCQRSWLENNYPELSESITSKLDGHLNWAPENYGYKIIA